MLFPPDTGEAAGEDSSLCLGLTAALANHPELADKVTEVVAALGREGTCTYMYMHVYSHCGSWYLEAGD